MIIWGGNIAFAIHNSLIFNVFADEMRGDVAPHTPLNVYSINVKTNFITQ